MTPTLDEIKRLVPEATVFESFNNGTVITFTINGYRTGTDHFLVQYLLTTQPQPVHGVPSEQRCKCPRCGSEEIDAMTARTVYDCGSSDYDARPGTFRQSDKCTLLNRHEGRS